MPSNLVRITFDKKAETFIVEYGTRYQAGLTPEEESEMYRLEEELMQYPDFTTAEDLDDEMRQGLADSKRRHEDLAARAEREHIEWVPVEPQLIESILLILEATKRPIYVENLPSFLLEKLLQSQLTLNLNTVVGAPMPSPRARAGVSNLQQVENVLDGCTQVLNSEGVVMETFNWRDLPIEVIEEGNAVLVKPLKFLTPHWKPINEALKAAFGDHWKSKGKGDKDAHWRIDFTR